MANANILKFATKGRPDAADLAEQIGKLGSFATAGPRLDTSVLKALSKNNLARTNEITKLLDGIQSIFEPRDATATVLQRSLGQIFEAPAVLPSLRGIMTDPIQKMLANSDLAAMFRTVDLELFNTDFTGFNFTPQLVERPAQLQPRQRRRYTDEVDEFLFRVRPDLVMKRRGTEDLHRSADPVSQAACSGAELISHLFRTLVTDDEVRDQFGGSPTKRPAWRDRLLLVRAKYDLDAETYAEIEHGVLVTRSRLEDIKHDTHLHSRADLTVELEHLERLLLVIVRAIGT